jgi:hypothetical protein
VSKYFRPLSRLSFFVMGRVGGRRIEVCNNVRGSYSSALFAILQIGISLRHRHILLGASHLIIVLLALGEMTRNCANRGRFLPPFPVPLENQSDNNNAIPPIGT